MQNKTILIFAGTIAIIVGVLVAFGLFDRDEITHTTYAPKVLTYTNDKYGIQFDYPIGWKVTVDERFPVIEVYKMSETNNPPFGLHSTTTNIAIYPEGLGTEGPMSETKEVTTTIAGQSIKEIQFMLNDGTVWGRFIPLKGPEAKGWKEFSFIWAGNHVANKKVTCMFGNQPAPAKDQHEFGCEFGVRDDARTVVSGQISPEDKAILDEIIKSIRFI